MNKKSKLYRVEFRRMDIEDIPFVLKIEQQSFTMCWNENMFREELLMNPFAQYIVMIYDEQVIGYAGMWTIIEEAHMTNIAVDSDFRGYHLGERLLDELMRLAVELGMVRITLEVRASNKVAQNLYKKKGFDEAGIRKAYYSDNGEDACIMWATLRNGNI